MDIGRDTPFSIRSAIERAQTRDEVVAAGRELPQVVLALVDASSEPVGVGRVVALVVDAMTTRLLTLGIERFGEPPVAWAWLALGQRRAARTGARHAIRITRSSSTRPRRGSKEVVDPYFAELAGFVTDGLEAAGIPRCKGDAMAVNPAMREIGPGLGRCAAHVDARPGSSGSILSSIVYDFRRVTGPLDSEPELEATIHEARHDTAFLSHLGTANPRPPAADRLPAGSGGRAEGRARRTAGREARRDHDHREHRAAGGRARGDPGQGNARPAGRRRRPPACSTGTSASELSEAFRFLWEVRLRHQAGQVRARGASRTTSSIPRRSGR